MLFEGVCFSQGHVIKGFLGSFWFQMVRILHMARILHRALHPRLSGFGGDFGKT